MRLDEWQKYLEEQFVDTQQEQIAVGAVEAEEPVLTELTGDAIAASPQTISHAIVTEAILPISDCDLTDIAAARENGKRMNRRQSLSLYPIITSEPTAADLVPGAGVSTRSIKPLKFNDGMELDVEIPEFGTFVARKNETSAPPSVENSSPVNDSKASPVSAVIPRRLAHRRAPQVPLDDCEPPQHWFTLQQAAARMPNGDDAASIQQQNRRVRVAQRLLNPLISMAEAAALLEISPVQMQRLAAQGAIKLIKTRKEMHKSSENNQAVPGPAVRRVFLSEVMRYRREREMQLGFAADLEFSEPGV